MCAKENGLLQVAVLDLRLLEDIGNSTLTIKQISDVPSWNRMVYLHLTYNLAYLNKRISNFILVSYMMHDKKSRVF